MAKRKTFNSVEAQPSSPFWHPAGGNSVWWRHYGAASNQLYSQCAAKKGAAARADCCHLYNLHASQAVFRLPTCCRVGGAVPGEAEGAEAREKCQCSRVAIFDLDGTLITTRSGKKFPTSAQDWRLLFDPHVRAKLQRLHELGYSIFILSNQLGVAVGHVSLEEITSKVDGVQQALAVPLTACLCCCDDLYRKPRPTAGAFIFKNLLPLLLQQQQQQQQQQVAAAASEDCKYPRVFYVGDAAGRPGDHSAADLKFALNAGIRFFTPEEFFEEKAAPLLPLLSRRASEGKRQLLGGGEGSLGSAGKRKASEVAAAAFDPCELLKGEAQPHKKSATDTETCTEAKAPAQELVVLIGAPGSGKSTLVEKLFPGHGVVRQDDLKTKAKCEELCARLLREGRSVAIDRQNATKEDRQVFIQLAKQHAPGCAVRGLALLWPKEVCLHLGQFRSLAAALRARAAAGAAAGAAAAPAQSASRFRLAKVPKVVVNSFYAKVEPPTLEEGFGSVEILQDVARDFLLHNDFVSDEERRIFASFLD